MQRDPLSPIPPASPARRPRSPIRRVPVLAALVAAALGVTAGGAVAQTTNPPAVPFARGTLTGLSGSTLQVQGRNGTSAVVVNATTTYEQTKAATIADVVAGDCIRAVGTGSASSGIQATSVALSTPQGKAGCTAPGANGRAPNGQRFGGQRTNGQTPPFSIPNGGSRPANFGAAFGAVKSVSGDQITVRAQVPDQAPTQRAAGTKGSKKQKTATQTVAVTVDGATALTQTVSATQKELTVGACVSASGTVDSVGTITAKNVTLSQPQNGSCTGFGFGGFGGFGPGRGDGNGGSGPQNRVT